MKTSMKIMIIALAILLISSLAFASITGTETMTRTSSVSTVNPSSTFTLTYTAVGTSGTWGASIVDSVSGGCKFPDGTTSLKTVILSPDGLTKTLTISAPASGSCTFTGDYQYGDKAVKAFSSLTVAVCQPNCNVRPTDLCQATSSNGCGGTCSWTVTKKTNADTNCNNAVDRTELGVYITKWINNEVTRTDLGNAIMAWVG